VVGKGFEKAARTYARAYKLPEIRLLLVDDTVAHQGGDELARMAAESVDRVVGEWTGGSRNEAAGASSAAEWLPFITVEGDFLEANRLLLERGLTDGLPVIPPGPKLVERFVAASGRSGSEVIARLMPLMGDITVERIAANAVMAGCAPEVMPILVTVVQAMGAEEYRVNHVVTTAHTLFPLIVVGGPVAKEVGMSDGRDLSAEGWRPNATIARAVRLIMYNCMSLPGVHGATCQGHLGKVADAVTENIEQSPWEPIHVEMGFRPTDSVVTVMSVEPMQMVDDTSALTAQGVLANFGSQMATSGNRPMFGPAQHMLIFGPAHANKVAQGGFDRKLVRRFIYEVYRIPVHQFPPESRERWSNWRKMLYGANTMEHATVPVVEDIDDIMIMVHGGAGPNSFFAPGINNHRSVTRKIG
jgi:hypothetical protein